MAQSYLLACSTAGMHVRIACPTEFVPNSSVVRDAEQLANIAGSSVLVTTDPHRALLDADVVVTDTWVSMGKEAEKQNRLSKLRPFQVDESLMEKADSEAIFLHCLPADRGYEVSSEVIDGPQSVVWDQSENRLHAQKALLVWLLRRS